MQSNTSNPIRNGTAAHARGSLCQSKPFMPTAVMLPRIMANGANGVNGFLCPQLPGSPISGIQAITMSVQTAQSTSVASRISMITWKRQTSGADAARATLKIIGVMKVRLCGVLIKWRRTSCAGSATHTLKIRTMLTRYDLAMSLHYDLLLTASQHQQVHLPRDKECYGCYRKFPSLSGMMIHLESGACSSQVTIEDINSWAWKYYPLHKYFDSQSSNHYGCPGCEHRFIYLSGLLQHLESNACNGTIGKNLKDLPTFLENKISQHVPSQNGLSAFVGGIQVSF
jgi:hypothetical protein